jgi:heat shock protein HslJ
MKKISLVLIGVAVLVAAFYAFNAFIYYQKQADVPAVMDHKDAQFVIEGEVRGLGDALQYFGNELRADLNADGREDVVFLVTYSPGGSGTFYYVVAALAAETGYEGSDGYLLGDRIAPQTTHMSQNPRHQNVVVVNFADRNSDESMTTRPSVGKSVYLKIDENNRWGVVEADFPGEADPSTMSLGMKTWVWQSASYNDGREVVPQVPDAFSLTFSDDGSFRVTTDCNSAGGSYAVAGETLSLGDMFSTKMYCEGAQEEMFLALLRDVVSYHFTGTGELVLGLKFDSGTVTLR